jgi:hypothetical protein
MLSDLKIVKILTLVPLAVLTAAAQTGPVAVKSPDGALEISFTTMGRPGQAAGGQPAPGVRPCQWQVASWRIAWLFEGSLCSSGRT